MDTKECGKAKSRHPESASQEEWNRTDNDYSKLWHSEVIPPEEPGLEPGDVNIAEDEWKREDYNYSKVWNKTGIKPEK